MPDDAPKMTPTLDEALDHHRAGRLAEAETLYRQILRENPRHAEALHLLGALAAQTGRGEAAVDLIRQAVAIEPNFPEALGNLGKILLDLGRPEEAMAACRQAIAVNPGYADAYSKLGMALRERGQAEEAIAAFGQAIDLDPGHAEAWCNLGVALRDKGQLEAAMAAHRKTIALNPNIAEAHYNLANELREAGQLAEAAAAYQRAARLRPKHPETHYNLGVTLRDLGQLDAAVTHYRQAIALRPNYPEAQNNLGVALADQGKLEEAIAAHGKAIALRPDFVEAHSNLVYVLEFHPGYDARAMADERSRWNRRHAEPLKTHVQPPVNERDPERRLRIGYVSPDFRNHVVGRNMLPLFRHHDRSQFDVFCYADLTTADRWTEEFRRLAGTFRVVTKMTHEALATQIRADRIDVLVDLALHMAGNRMLVFARKPAPVQVTFAGYPGSTGLRAIDYRLSDPYLDPPGMDESVYSEQTLRLPDSFWCYDPLENWDIPVSSLPARETGRVTFGCLNNFCKVNDEVLALWAQVLQQVAGSRLLLLAPAGSHRQRTVARFGQEGLAPERVEFVAYQPRRKYLEQYHRIDIGLDTFPYNGHTTSLDSFWMGVPVVTWVGRTAVGRAGWSQLCNLGMPELAGQTAAEFVRIAAMLAGDLRQLEHMRATLRQRMAQSRLMDGPHFARHIEAAYRQMWRTWCARGSGDGLAE
jgi:protein O-GlcNAc transferase